MPLNFIFLSFLFLMTSCNDQEKKEKTTNELTGTEINSKAGTEQDTSLTQEKQPQDVSGAKTTANNTPVNTNQNLEGTYARIDIEDEKCDYYCLEVNFSEESRLCLHEDEIYINGRFRKKGEHVEIFYVGPAQENINEDLPWDKFDTNTPIAVLSPGGDADMELDWKGLHIDGKLAVDYAIYGKKTLEGSYKKK